MGLRPLEILVLHSAGIDFIHQNLMSTDIQELTDAGGGRLLPKYIYSTGRLLCSKGVRGACWIFVLKYKASNDAF